LYRDEQVVRGIDLPGKVITLPQREADHRLGHCHEQSGGDALVDDVTDRDDQLVPADEEEVVEVSAHLFCGPHFAKISTFEMWLLIDIGSGRNARWIAAALSISLLRAWRNTICSAILRKA
jgi:hypothetical protein